MRRAAFFFILFLAGTTPAEVYSAGALPVSGRKQQAYAYPKNDVWSAALVVMKGLPLKEADADKGEIKTEWLSYNVIKRNFALFGSASTVRLRLFISIKGNEQNSHVRILSRQEEQKYAGKQALRPTASRRSDGTIEEEFLQRLAVELANRYGGSEA